MENNELFNEVDKILKNHHNNKTEIIAILQEIQKQYNYLPQEILEYVSKKISISEAKIYGIATFYENFSLEPKGKYIIRICDGTACHVRKSADILNACKAQLGLYGDKHTTDDNIFTVETVSCLGACGLSPVLTVNDRVYPSMNPEKVNDLINSIREGEQK